MGIINSFTLFSSTMLLNTKTFLLFQRDEEEDEEEEAEEDDVELLTAVEAKESPPQPTEGDLIGNLID
jgi:chromatin segregation and condensation protein Rec8/ScpA/Scc1 (kleisin family)